MSLGKKKMLHQAADSGVVNTENFAPVTYTGNGGTQKITGYIRKGAAFNGSSSYISITQPVDLSTDNFTYSFWIYPTTNADYGAPLAQYGNSTPTRNFYSYRVGSTEKITFGLVSTGAVFNQLISTGTTPLNQWSHVALVRDSSTQKIYLNGQLSGTLSNTTTTSTSSEPFLIGDTNDSVADEFFEGKIDQVRIFNKALSSSEVTTLYGETSASTTISTTDIFGDGSGVALYELDEDAGDTGGTYNGTATDVNYLGMAFQPDLVWIKNRDYSGGIGHQIFDSVRGDTQGSGGSLSSSSTAAEYFDGTKGVKSFDVNGFTVDGGANGQYGVNGASGGTYGSSYVAWNWKAGGAAVSNTDGSITSSVSANPDAGFSIVKAQGTGTYPTINTVGHGLNQAPEMIIVKDIDQVAGWLVYHTGLTDSTGYLTLNATSAEQTDTNAWGNQEPTSSIFAITNGWTINTNSNFIAYCFHSVDGYQKVGSYSGSNSPITVTTGFQPRFVLIKRTDASGNSWVIIDSVREIGSGADALFPDLAVVESSGWNTDFISTGFTISSNESYISASGGTYIYLAIA